MKKFILTLMAFAFTICVLCAEEKVLFDSNKIGVFSLLASIPGVLVILGIIYFLFIQFSKKIEILKNKE